MNTRRPMVRSTARRTRTRARAVWFAWATRRAPVGVDVWHPHLDDSQKTLSPRLSKGIDMSSSDRHELRSGVPILRLFKACARPNCESALAEKLATSSVQVVRDEAGFLGFVCAGPANNSDRDFVFASIWRDADAIKARFGDDWRVSFLPPGYAELIEECSVEHYQLTEQSFPR